MLLKQSTEVKLNACFVYTNLYPRLGVGGGGVERHGEDGVVGRDGHRVLTRGRLGDLVTVVVVDSEHVDGGGHSVWLLWLSWNI